MATTNSNTIPIGMANWTKEEVDILVVVMIEEVMKGNKTQALFNTRGWNNIKEQCDLRIGREFNMRQFKNKFNKLRDDYSSFKRMLETTGFGWDPDTRTCTMDDPSIWESHIKDNPKWTKYRRNGLSQWPELQMIYGDSYATGDRSVGHAQNINILQAEDEGIRDEKEEDINLDKNLAEGRHRLNRPPSSLRRKRKGGDLASAINNMADVSHAKFERYTSLTSVAPAAVITKNFSVTECMKVLDDLNLEKDLYMKTLDKMMENQTWREAFVNIADDKRMWMLEKL